MIYGYLTTKIIIELELWDLVHGGLLGTYDKSTIKHQTCGATTKKDVSLTCMTMTELATNCFEMIKVLHFDLEEVMSGNDEYIYINNLTG